MTLEAPSVLYADLYHYLRNRILAGTDPDFSTVTYDATKSWHFAPNDQHLNAYGHLLKAAAVRSAIPPACWPERQVRPAISPLLP